MIRSNGEPDTQRKSINMAKNTGAGYRRGAVTSRSQFQTPSGWIKRDTATGRIMDRKADNQPFKGVRRER